MLWRKIIARFEEFKKDARKAALMITGARQVGKTFIVREFARTHYESFIEFNFIKNPAARDIFEKAVDEKDVLLRLSAMADGKLIPGRTLIFFDEVQVCPEAVTFVKFLVEEGSYRYVFSGSLHGVLPSNVWVAGCLRRRQSSALCGVGPTARPTRRSGNRNHRHAAFRDLQWP